MSDRKPWEPKPLPAISKKGVSEWWIDPTSDPEDECDFQCFDALSQHPGQGPLEWQANLIHVIEKSAYDALQAKLAEANEHISGNVCGYCWRKMSNPEIDFYDQAEALAKVLGQYTHTDDCGYEREDVIKALSDYQKFKREQS